MTSVIGSISLLIVIFLSILGLIILVRFIIMSFIERSYKRYLALKKAAKKALPSKRRKHKKSEEDLKRNIEIPRSQSAMQAERIMKSGNESGSYEIMESDDQEHDDLEQSNIVDFVKPIGFFTSMILGQKLTYLVQSAQVLNKRGNKGFWVSMIEAKDRSAGRQHGRG
jgi:hypothetical protein